jgi:hypothetical protein
MQHRIAYHIYLVGVPSSFVGSLLSSPVGSPVGSLEGIRVGGDVGVRVGVPWSEGESRIE